MERVDKVNQSFYVREGVPPIKSLRGGASFSAGQFSGSGHRYLHLDHLGSTDAVTNAARLR